MYCLYIIAKGVRKEGRFKEGHDASKFPIPLRFFCRAVLLGPLPVLQIYCFGSVHGATQKKCVVYSNFSPFFSFFLSFYLLSFHSSYLKCSLLQCLLVTFPNLTGCYHGRKISLPVRWWNDLAATVFFFTSHLVANHSGCFNLKVPLAWTVAAEFWVAAAFCFFSGRLFSFPGCHFVSLVCLQGDGAIQCLNRRTLCVLHWSSRQYRDCFPQWSPTLNDY